MIDDLLAHVERVGRTLFGAAAPMLPGVVTFDHASAHTGANSGVTVFFSLATDAYPNAWGVVKSPDTYGYVVNVWRDGHAVGALVEVTDPDLAAACAKVTDALRVSA